MQAASRNIPYKVEIVHFLTDNDSIGEAITKRAEALKAAAVVVAKHQRGKISEFFLGSVTKVTETSPLTHALLAAHTALAAHSAPCTHTARCTQCYLCMICTLLSSTPTHRTRLAHSTLLTHSTLTRALHPHAVPDHARPAAVGGAALSAAPAAPGPTGVQREQRLEQRALA